MPPGKMERLPGPSADDRRSLRLRSSAGNPWWRRGAQRAICSLVPGSASAGLASGAATSLCRDVRGDLPRQRAPCTPSHVTSSTRPFNARAQGHGCPICSSASRACLPQRSFHGPGPRSGACCASVRFSAQRLLWSRIRHVTRPASTTAGPLSLAAYRPTPARVPLLAVYICCLCWPLPPTPMCPHS